MMRIVVLPSAFAPAVGGVEELSARLAHHLTSRGHVVEVWTIRHPAELPAIDSIDGITVRRFDMPLPAAKLGNALRFAPGAVRALWEMGRAARAFSADVLHVQCFSAQGVYAAALSVLLGVPLVVTLQGETFMDDNDIYDRSTSLKLGLRVGLRRAHTVTACSQYVLDDTVRRFGLEPGAGIVIPNGVDVHQTPPAVGLELPFERFVLGVGRVVEKKGFDLLIEAFAQVARDRPDVGLVIGGDGAARPGLLAQARDLGLADRVVLPGVLARGQVAWAMNNAAAFVLPSRIEPFGIVVLEALKAGAPVIVSARGGAPEIVRDGVEGLVVDPFNAPALAGAVRWVLDDTALRERLTKAARVRVQDFAWESITERYVALYEDASTEGSRTAKAAPPQGRP